MHRSKIETAQDVRSTSLPRPKHYRPEPSPLTMSHAIVQPVFFIIPRYSARTKSEYSVLPQGRQCISGLYSDFCRSTVAGPFYCICMHNSLMSSENPLTNDHSFPCAGAILLMHRPYTLSLLFGYLGRPAHLRCPNLPWTNHYPPHRGFSA
jgi:hypothetical protein